MTTGIDFQGNVLSIMRVYFYNYIKCTVCRPFMSIKWINQYKKDSHSEQLWLSSIKLLSHTKAYVVMHKISLLECIARTFVIDQFTTGSFLPPHFKYLGHVFHFRWCFCPKHLLMSDPAFLKWFLSLTKFSHKQD